MKTHIKYIQLKITLCAIFIGLVKIIVFVKSNSKDWMVYNSQLNTGIELSK
jgi:hypothetical protein